jgi:hypothetical protein
VSGGQAEEVVTEERLADVLVDAAVRRDPIPETVSRRPLDES